MEACVAYGIEEGVNVTIFPSEIFTRFEIASSKAKVALNAAGIFCKSSRSWLQGELTTHLVPFCTTEPRIKGSFRGLASIYSEVIKICQSENSQIAEE